MELLPAIVGLAVVDSINPSALLATIVLLLRGRPARPLVALYVAAILVTYFAVGLALTLGLGSRRGRWSRATPPTWPRASSGRPCWPTPCSPPAGAASAARRPAQGCPRSGGRPRY